MREIKFRGRVPDKGWLYGDLRHIGNNLIYIVDKFGHGSSVNPNTVGQFTGLLDTAQKEIYEGDIVKVVDDGEESLHVVKYMVEEDYPAFDLDPVLNDGECNSLSYCLNDLDTRITVIGNIHDNPELLRLTKK